MLDYQLDSVKKEFVNYLTSLGLSPKSHKNYRSDLSHFVGWLILKIRSFGAYVNSLTESVPFISNDLAKEYRNYMVENSVSKKTANRRLATLRHLSRFMLSSQTLDFDFMEGIENVLLEGKVKTKRDAHIVDEFKAHLINQKVSANTVKNYVSDIRQFLNWLELNNIHTSN